MVDLKRITRGRVDKPPKVVIYGFDGIGKTGFAAGAPGTFFLDANRGSHKYDVQRVDVGSWAETFEWLSAIENEQVKCATVVLDSMTDFEAMLHAQLFPNSTVTKYEGGYGKGDDAVIMEARKLLAQLERLWERGKAIVLVGHATVKKFEDPTGPGYERFEIGCRPKFSGMLRQWSDYVFFAREDVIFAAEKNKPVKATTTQARWIYTRRCPAFDAKARGTTMFPERIALSWSEFDSAVKNDEARTDVLREEIEKMLAQLGDSKLESQVRQYVKEYPGKLVEAHNRLSARLEEKMVVSETKVEGEKAA